MPTMNKFLSERVTLPLWLITATLAAFTVGILVLTLPKSFSAKDEKLAESYAVGFTLGRQINRIKDQIDSSTAARGFRDGILSNEKEEPSLMSADSRAESLRRIQNRQADTERKISEAELNRSVAFMDSIRKKTNVRELEAGIIVEPVNETKAPTAAPKEHASMMVAFKAKRPDGTVFDQSAENGVEIKAGSLVPGLRKALSRMPEGAHWLIYLAPHQAFGGSYRPGVPSQSVVIYDLKLIKTK